MELEDIHKGLSPKSHTDTDSAADCSAAESVVFPDEESEKATKKAMALLLHKDRTAWELKDRLYRAGVPETASEFAFAYVSKYGYINDLRYATGYIDYHKTTKSKNEIRRKLKEKGIQDEVIEEAFLSYADVDAEEGASTDAGDPAESVDPEVIALRTLLRKRLKGRDISELTYEEKQKQMRYLAGKGFPTGMIRREILGT